MKYSWLILLITISFTVCTKRKKGETFPEHVTLRITVKDNNGVIRPGTKVQLFSVESDYSKAVDGDTTVIPYKQAIADASGVVILDTVEANIDQWLLATLTDTANNVVLSNQNLSSTITQLLPGSVIDMEVIIEPLSANVAFYSTSPADLPVYVKFRGQLDSVTVPTAAPGAITPTSGDALIVPVAPGTYPYQAYVKGGCTWTGSLDINKGDFVKVGFDACQLARVTFYFYDVISTPTMQFGPYDVFVDDVRQGSLSAIYPNGGPLPPASVCGQNDNVLTVTAYVESGIPHTYRVKANGSPCTWISTIPVLAPGACHIVNLAKTTSSGNQCP